jgi:sigma-B regulation protein RsbU (phosphoserine phosphatase)
LARPALTAEARAALDACACGLLTTAKDGTILFANRVFSAWVGVGADALSGARFQDLLTIGARIFHQTHWAPLLEMQGSISEVKLDVRHADGNKIPMVFNAVRRGEGDGVVHEIAAFVARDRDSYERELVGARQRLEAAVRELRHLEAQAKERALAAEQMIGIVSHDLRNPLSSIGLGTQLLAESPLDGDQRRTLERIARATKRANTLIADLLDFTQARLGKGLSVSLGSIDLHESIAHAVEELTPIYKHRRLEHVARGAGACRGDANRLAQLVGNLVTNAMTYGDPSLPVTVTSASEDDGCTLTVHNHGAPIPPEVQARIFEPMTRASQANAGRSVGLGLFIVREIAQAHGGTVTVESSESAGTTFCATFPRR